MWSFGVLFYKLMAGRYPFDSASRCKQELYSKILDQELVFLSDMSFKDISILETLLKKNASNRPNFKEIVSALDKIL